MERRYHFWGYESALGSGNVPDALYYVGWYRRHFDIGQTSDALSRWQEKRGHLNSFIHTFNFNHPDLRLINRNGTDIVALFYILCIIEWG